MGLKSNVIEYRGPRDVLVWQHECESIDSRTTIIVDNGQEAMLVQNGQLLGPYGQGSRRPKLQNTTVVRGLASLFSGGKTPYPCRVYYINKEATQLLEWGTDSPIVMRDPVNSVTIRLRAYGDMWLRVRNGRQLLMRLVGTDSNLTQRDIRGHFRNLVASRMRNCIASTMAEQGIGGYQVDQKLVAIGDAIQGMLRDPFDDYGLVLERFTVSAIHVDGLEVVSRGEEAVVRAQTQARIDELRRRGARRQ